MSLFRRAFRGTIERAFTNISGPPTSLLGDPSFDGTQSSSLQQSAVWACVRLRAETIAALPTSMVKYQAKTRELKPTPVWLDTPNEECTPYGLFEYTAASLDLDGNAFWYKVRDRLGRVIEVWPVNPSRVEVYRPKPGQPKKFRIADDRTEYTTDDFLHILGFNPFGRLRAPSPIQLHAEAIGLALTTQSYAKSYFDRGSIPSGVIEAPDSPDESEAERMRATFEKNHRGPHNAHRPAFLFGGATWKQLQIPNDAAQFLETRRYQTTEIARIFRVPPHKIGDLERATFSNIEHQGIEWATDGVSPYTGRIAAAINADPMLRGPDDSRMVFNLAGLFRGDIKSMYAAFAVGRQWGWLSVDDIRAMLDMNPLPEAAGEVYLQPLNMVAAGQLTTDPASLMPAPDVPKEP